MVAQETSLKLPSASSRSLRDRLRIASREVALREPFLANRASWSPHARSSARLFVGDVSCTTIRNIKTLKTQWSERQEQLKAEGLTAKEAQRLHIETRKLNILEQIRAEGGPFTSVEEVETYLSDGNIDDDRKGKRMRREVTYARDSCVSLPRNHKVFRIFNTSVKSRRLLTQAEFGENLKILLGKRAGRITITMQEFSDALHELYQADIGN